jgi:pyruvate,water dikinase
MGELFVLEGTLDDVDDVFYLRLDEILPVSALKDVHLKELVKRRKAEFESFKAVEPPVHFVTVHGAPPVNHKEYVQGGIGNSRPASPGVVRGKVRVFREFAIPESIDFDILVTSHTDPGWTPLIALSKGLIIEHGGVLSHASIVARELNIPAVIGARNAVKFLKDGQIVEINGSTGSIKII